MKEETEILEKNRMATPLDDENEQLASRHPHYLCRVETRNAVFGVILDRSGRILYGAPISRRLWRLSIHDLVLATRPTRVDVLINGSWRPLRPH